MLILDIVRDPNLENRLAKAKYIIDKFGQEKKIKKEYLEKAKINYEKLILEENMAIKGSTIEDTAIAVLYMTCKENHCSLLPGDLPDPSVFKRYKKIKRDHAIKTPVSQPKDYLNRLARGLESSGNSILLAKKIIENLPPNNLRPSVVAAASLYIAMKLQKEGVSYYKITELIDVTYPTMSRAVKEIMKMTGIKQTF